jgi:protocatechuate 3,4-dioxygenase beta subunit
MNLKRFMRHKIPFLKRVLLFAMLGLFIVLINILAFHLAFASQPSQSLQATISANKEYVKQTGSPTYLSNTFHPDLGCNWLGVAGQVFAADKSPQKGMVLQVGGTLGDKVVSAMARTGSATAYGPGGYEVKLSDSPVKSSGKIWLEVYNDKGSLVSERIYFDTYETCDKNLTLINFVSTSPYVTPTTVVNTVTPSSFTATPLQTPTKTISPTKIFTTTKVSTSTRTQVATFTPRPPTRTLTPTATKFAWFYSPQAESPTYMQNYAHPDKGCSWLGVAGLVFDEHGHPVYNVVVEVGGTLNNKKISVLTLTGFASAYGSGGYEVQLATKTITSSKALYVVLYDLNGKQLSNKIYFNTYNDCKRNLTLLNFAQTGPSPTQIPITPVTATFTPTPTITPTITFTPTPTMYSPPRYEVQSGSPIYIGNLYHPEKGCQWMGISGQVFDARAKPVKNLIIEVGGRLSGRDVFALVLTGLSPKYGQGGFEVVLSSEPVLTHDSLWIMVHDLSGNNLSDHISFDTFSDCGRNLILMNFQQKP